MILYIKKGQDVNDDVLLTLDLKH